LIPPAALLLGALVLDEKVSGQALAGLVFILLGLAVVDGRPVQAVVRLCRRRRRPAAS
jgi:drug/metabolite transporter (DMT)-like permease